MFALSESVEPPVSDTFIVASVQAEHDAEGTGALEREIDPPSRLGMLVIEKTPRHSQACDRNHLQVRRVEYQRPPREVKPVRVIILRIEAPALHPLGVFHAVQGPVARRGSFLGDLFLNCCLLVGAQNVVQPFERTTHRNRGLGGALETDRVFAPLEEIVPLLVVKDPLRRQPCGRALFPVSRDRIDKRGPFEDLPGLEEILDVVVQTELFREELPVGVMVGGLQPFPEFGKPGEGERLPYARNVGSIEEEPARSRLACSLSE